MIKRIVGGWVWWGWFTVAVQSGHDAWSAARRANRARDEVRAFG